MRTLTLFLLLFHGSILTASVVPRVTADAPLLSLSSPEGSEQVGGKFVLRNHGPVEAIILSAKPDCSCVSILPYPRRIGAGEAIELSVNYRFVSASNSDRRQVQLAVRGMHQPLVLKLEVSREQPIKLSSGVLVWRKGETLLPKSITVTVNAQSPRVLRRHALEENGFKVMINPDETGKSGSITVVPTAPGNKHSKIAVPTQVHDLMEKSGVLYAIVE